MGLYGSAAFNNAGKTSAISARGAKRRKGT
jgi:hypothetical protein